MRFFVCHDNPPDVDFEFENDEITRQAYMLDVVAKDKEIVRLAVTFSGNGGRRQTVFLLRLMAQITFEYHTGS